MNILRKIKIIGLLWTTACLFAACAFGHFTPSPNMQTSPRTTSTSTLVPSPPPTQAASVHATETPARDATPAPSPTPEPIICPPLEGISLDNLSDSLVNRFQPPPAGSDEPHQGVDLADLSGSQRIAIAGRGVQAILSGRVASVIDDRFPYGNAILIETSIEDLPSPLRTLVPAVAPTPERQSALTCPQSDLPLVWNVQQRSVYILYAHMQAKPDLQPGQAVVCGQVIGAIGSSGNALNPHLHVEGRVGPQGAMFASMAHYDASASPDEMASYCAWRTSGWFELIDPEQLLGIKP